MVRTAETGRAAPKRMQRLLYPFGVPIALALIAAGCDTPAEQGGDGDAPEESTEAEDEAGDSGDGEVEEVRLAAITSTSSHYVYVTQVANEISGNSEIQNWSVLETGGIADNHAMLERGEADVIISAPATLYEAVNGVGEFEDVGPQENLRALWTWVIPPQNMVARADAGIEELSDLDGQPVLPGGTGTSTATIFRDMFEILGISPEFLDGSLDDGVTFMTDGTAVAFGKASPGFVPDSTYQQMQSSIDIAPVGFSEDEVGRIQDEMPYVDFVDVPPDTVIEGADGFTTWAAPLVFVTTDDMPEDVAFEAIEAAVGAQDEIAESYTGTADVDYFEDSITTASTGETPLHPGMVSFLEQEGVDVPSEVRP